jgi:hypothetical protein
MSESKRSLPDVWRYELLNNEDESLKGSYIERRFDSHIALVSRALRAYRSQENLNANDIILMYRRALPTRSISPRQTIRNVVRDTAEDLGNHAIKSLVFNEANDIYHRKYWLKLNWSSPGKLLNTEGLEELKNTVDRAIEAGASEENVFSGIGFVSLHENGDFFAGYASPFTGTITHSQLAIPTTRSSIPIVAELKGDYL